MRKFILAVAVAALAIVAVASSALAGGGTGITATPAATKTWAGHQATFVRSASGIINETNRVNLDSAGPQNSWTSADVWLQFRPLTGPTGTGTTPTPNPNCDPVGLVTSFSWSNDPVADPNRRDADGRLLHRDEPVQRVRVSRESDGCVRHDRLGCPQRHDGESADRPEREVPDRRQRHVDERQQRRGRRGVHVRRRSWTTTFDGYDRNGFLLGEGFGDVQVNGGFVGWGASSSSHAYSYAATGLSGAVNLAVFDGDSSTVTKDAGWYGDNSGSLNYTITYVGL